MNKRLQVIFTAIVFGSALLACSNLNAKHLPHSKPEVTVAILMFDGVQIIDFAGPYEVFGQAGFGVFTLSEGGKPVETAMGLHTKPDYSLKDTPEFDVLLVPGGDVDAVSQNAAVLRFIKQHAAKRKQVMSVCTGSYILAEAGILDGVEATTFHRSLADFDEKFPAVKTIRDVRWTDSENVITSAGLSSGIDAALHLVGKHRSTEIARSTALHLEYDWQPEQGFIRTTLADRYLPDVQVDWPRRTRLKNLYSIGDKSHWRRRFLITSPSDSNELIALIEQAMDGLKDWTRKSVTTRSWISKQNENTLRVQLTYIGSREGAHELEILLNVE